MYVRDVNVRGVNAREPNVRGLNDRGVSGKRLDGSVSSLMHKLGQCGFLLTDLTLFHQRLQARPALKMHRHRRSALSLLIEMLHRCSAGVACRPARLERRANAATHSSATQFGSQFSLHNMHDRTKSFRGVGE